MMSQAAPTQKSKSENSRNKKRRKEESPVGSSDDDEDDDDEDNFSDGKAAENRLVASYDISNLKEWSQLVDMEALTRLEEKAGLSAQAASFDIQKRIEMLRQVDSVDIMSLVKRPRAQRRASVGGKWTSEEDMQLKEIVEQHGPKNWKKIAALLGDVRTDVQCLHRYNKVLKPGLHKGTWAKDEDQLVKDMVMQYGIGRVKWSAIASQLPGRIGKQCRERWFNHLDPSIKKGDWSSEEEIILFEAQRHFGNRWCEISKMLPGRTENAVKNRWNSCTMKKWLKDRGLEPGNGNTVTKETTKEDMAQAVEAFTAALAAAGVELEINSSAALQSMVQHYDQAGGGQISNSSSNAKPKKDKAFAELTSPSELKPADATTVDPDKKGEKNTKRKRVPRSNATTGRGSATASDSSGVMAGMGAGPGYYYGANSNQHGSFAMNGSGMVGYNEYGMMVSFPNQQQPQPGYTPNNSSNYQISQYNTAVSDPNQQSMYYSNNSAPSLLTASFDERFNNSSNLLTASLDEWLSHSFVGACGGATGVLGSMSIDPNHPLHSSIIETSATNADAGQSSNNRSIENRANKDSSFTGVGSEQPHQRTSDIVPSHLIPAAINTSNSSRALKQPNEKGLLESVHDESANQLVNMLNQLKESPTAVLGNKQLHPQANQIKITNPQLISEIQKFDEVSLKDKGLTVIGTSLDQQCLTLSYDAYESLGLFSMSQVQLSPNSKPFSSILTIPDFGPTQEKSSDESRMPLPTNENNDKSAAIVSSNGENLMTAHLNNLAQIRKKSSQKASDPVKERVDQSHSATTRTAIPLSYAVSPLPEPHHSVRNKLVQFSTEVAVSASKSSGLYGADSTVGPMVVPLESIVYFKFLNDDAQRSIVERLVSEKIKFEENVATFDPLEFCKSRKYHVPGRISPSSSVDLKSDSAARSDANRTRDFFTSMMTEENSHRQPADNQSNLNNLDNVEHLSAAITRSASNPAFDTGGAAHGAEASDSKLNKMKSKSEQIIENPDMPIGYGSIDLLDPLTFFEPMSDTEKHEIGAGAVQPLANDIRSNTRSSRLRSSSRGAVPDQSEAHYDDPQSSNDATDRSIKSNNTNSKSKRKLGIGEDYIETEMRTRSTDHPERATKRR